MRTIAASALILTLLGHGVASAQPARPQAQQPPAQTAASAAAGASMPVEPGFTIGPEDVLGILFWRDQEMSGDVTVRHDGMITLPLVRDIKAAGLTPNELADVIQEVAREYVTDASVTVVVREMNSRKVFITGEVVRPGSYPLSSPMTVMQLIAVAGGLTEWADQKKISILRVEGVRNRRLPFHYRDVTTGVKAQQNILLQPGDTVVVPEK
jgi:polysaccharide biosynthesis/export protein